MADKIEDGGPAFAAGAANECTGWTQEGMSLRDWFAGQALAGLVGNSGGPYQSNSMSGWGIVNCDPIHVAGTCYELADAILRARKGDL